MMTTVMSLLMWSAGLLLLSAVSHVRLQCDSSATFMAHCDGITRRRSFLLYESATTETIECSRMDPNRWTRSPDGSMVGSVDLDNSSNRYTIDGRRLSVLLSNITGEDGGLYRCVYGDNSVTGELCIEVFERAVFESCPSEYDGCTETTQLSVTAGESAVFDASIMYTPGGSCIDSQQMLDRVMLWRVNSLFGDTNDLIFSCRTDDEAGCGENGRVSLSRGNKPGLEFQFSLRNTQVNDSSSYRVEVRGSHPQTGVTTELTKNFNLRVDPAPIVATSFPATSTVESTTSLSRDNPVGTGVASSGGNTGAVVAGVLVPLLVVAVVVIALGLLFLIVRWKQGSLPSPTYNMHKSSRVRKDAVQVESNNGTADLPRRANSITVTTVSRTEVQPVGNVPNILVNIEESVVVSLPPENTRMSYVDSNMHDLPSKLQLQEPGDLPLRAQSSPVTPLESRDVHV